MLASSTHDTKRSEDVRARINVLSEIPSEWYRAIRAWKLLNQDKKIPVAGELGPECERRVFSLPDAGWSVAPGPMNSEEHREFVARIHSYMEKALREAKVNTSWVNPNTEYEAAFHNFLDAVLDRVYQQTVPRRLHRSSRPGLRPPECSIHCPRLYSKSHLPVCPIFIRELKCGTSALPIRIIAASVNYHRLQTLLARLRAAESENPATLVDRLVAEPTDGSLKLFVTRSALRFRRENRAVFAKGSYLPLRPIGDRNKHLVAFARSFRETTLVVLAGRFFSQLGAQTRLPVGLETWEMRKSFCENNCPPVLIATCSPDRTVTPVRRNGNLFCR